MRGFARLFAPVTTIALILSAGLAPLPASASPAQAPDSAKHTTHAGPLGPTLVRSAGGTAVLIVAYRGNVSPALVTSANERALGVRFHNTIGARGQQHRIGPVPLLLLGTSSVPNVKAALAQVKRTHPVRLYLLGMTHDQRLTLVTNTLFDGLTVYINKTPGTVRTLAQLTGTVAAAKQFIPVIEHRGTGSLLANAEQVDASEAVTAPDIPLPPAVEIDPTYLPPVGDQGQQESCVGWSTAYYYKTYIEAKLHHWDPADPSHEFSPSYVYNQINHGQDQGSVIPDAMQVMVQQGEVPLTLFPYQQTDYLTQPTQQLIDAAAQFRSSDFGYLYAGYGKSAPDLNNLKRWLASGEGLVIGLNVALPSFQQYQGVYDGPYAGDTGYGGHAMFVIGYDDNGAGTGIGAFRVINSWTTSWGDNGYGWISYDYISAHLSDAWVMRDAPNGPLNQVPTATSVAAPTTAPTPAPIPTPVPQPTQPLGPSQVIYSGSGSYKLQPDAANRDFIANLTFTFAARDANGHTVEAHQTYFREGVDPNSDTVFSLHFTMDDGTVLTGQVEVLSPGLPG